MTKRILIINPNSSESMTQGLSTLITTPPSGFQLEFFTAPPTAPPSINNSEEGLLSCQECLKELKSKPIKYLEYDGYLVGCYSDHPLVYELRKLVGTKAQVMGIFQASVLYSLNSASEENKVAILTSGKDWEPILDEAVYRFFNGKGAVEKKTYSESLPPIFIPTLAAGVDVLKLADPDNYNILKNKVNQLIAQNASTILLGCAGLATLDGKLSSDFPNVTFVDSVKAGIELLVAYIRFQSYSKH
ncbi:unnamed protein product [Ambrosiozyma monospora]|uniref:Unnamed protein product n=1 Tax=Ambrosiozyma monospora TaxID=43982 RepID=A0ACB5T8M2_AMBMO|nr:unnamed protein product [Ambrosiozyma monospora]